MGKLCKHLLVIAVGVTLVLLSVAVMALIGGFYDATYPFENEYAIVIDAGSSSSKFYAYSWPEGLSAALGESVNISQVSQCTQPPGLDQITTPDQITLYFDPCISELRKIIPASKRNRTIVALGATAGMRLLNSSNNLLATEIIGYVRNYLNNTEFYYKDPNQVQIITGSQEGLFGWISANYFLDIFAYENMQSYGILDLGGASTQISYLPDNSNSYAQNATLQQYFNQIRIYGTNYNVYSASFLCYGVDQFLLVYQAYLITLGNYAADVNGACFSLGSSVNVTTSSLLASSCASGVAFSFPGGINLNLLIQRPYYIINGLSDVNGCQAQMSVLFSNSFCNYGSCSFNGVFLPNQTGNYFYGISNYYNAINNTEILSGKALKKDFNAYKNESAYLCSLTYLELTTLNNGIIIDRFLRTVCLNNNLVISLLTNYKITNFDNVNIEQDINGNSIGWSLGYLFEQINRDNFLPVEQPQKKLPHEFFLPSIIVSGVLTGLLLIILIGFIIYIIYY